jgi:hypothetical protein
MWARLLSLGGVCVAVIGLTGCGGVKRESERQLTAKASALAAGRSLPVVAVSHRTFVLAAGWMPSGRGFVITARRYRWRAHSYVALSASIVGRARTRAAIEHQAATGGYGSTQSNIGAPSARVLPTGLVDCSAHPTVLLFAWAAPKLHAGLREDGVTRRLRQAAMPAAVRLPAGVVLYGSQVSAATLVQPGAVTEPLSPPPRHQTCQNGTGTVMYAFGPRVLSSSGTG